MAFLSLSAAACSSGSDEGGDKGVVASEVCGGFAKGVPSGAALEVVMGAERFTSDLSEPDKALDALREAALIDQSSKSGKPRMQGIPFCWLLSAEDGERALRVALREESGVPDRDARFGDSVTYFSTGGRAYASDSLASVFFTCRIKAPAHEIVIATKLEGPDGSGTPQKDARAHLITIANAAARHVAAELGCQDPRLVEGVPVES
ncbi:hypothetical protein [Streptomyces sp. NBC_01353]|uniref:hypothetical protein n=1 Tax=Streptomyces sp. NBC_01353 TaxID=2903835 RepID=UPI002E366948|nr:hypothetical protein [Streptomyces sp. NBC_01353]